MKRFFEFLFVILLAASCARELNFPGEAPAGDYLSFNATLDDASTKTYLDGVQVKWEPADKVGLWYGTLDTGMTPAEYSVGSIGGDARQATLNGFAKASNDYMAVYPLSAALDCSKKGKLTVAFPMKQELKSGSFASGANVSVAYSNTTDLGFKNVGGLLALKVSSAGGHTIKKIRLMGTTAMAGEVEIKQASIADGAPCVDKFIEGINFLTLDCGDGIEDPYGISSAEGFSETPGTWGGTKAVTGTKATAYSGDFTYYLVSLPGSHTGFTLTFVDSDGKTAVARSSHTFEIARNGNTLIADLSLPDDRFKADKAVFINEISFNDNKIELYNPGDEAVDLTGYYFTKDDAKYWAIPAGTTIDAHGYKVFTCRQTDCSLGPTWDISGADGFELKLSNGKKVDKVDNTGDGKLTASDSETIGRKTDGGSEWVVFSTGTIYVEGVCDGDNSKGTVKKDGPVLTGSVVINEVNGNGKYVELHNLTDQPVDITGWKLEKDEKLVWTASDASQCTLAAHAYLVIDFVKGSENPKEAASGISAGKSVKVELKNAAGGCVDVFTRGSEPWGSAISSCSDSFGRTPDGSGPWKLIEPTPGTERQRVTYPFRSSMRLSPTSLLMFKPFSYTYPVY